MKKVIVLLPAALLALAGAMISGGAQAAAIAPGALRIAADQVSAVDKVQFVFRGRRYCWYYTGWRGPGMVLVRLSLAPRRGLGWSGRMARLAQTGSSPPWRQAARWQPA
jgi:hypothetical protein